jgi:hypothetical protein
MRSCTIAIAVFVALGLLSRGGSGQTTGRKSFEAKMFSIEDICHFGIDDERFAALTKEQKTSLVEARNVLMAMLQAIQHKRDVTKYASSEMVAKYKTSSALAASLIDPETSILAAGVSDFSLVDSGTIRLNFFAVVSSEGNIVVSEKAALLRQTDSGWRFAGFK